MEEKEQCFVACGIKNEFIMKNSTRRKFEKVMLSLKRHVIEVLKTVQVLLPRPGLHLLELMSCQERRRGGICYGHVVLFSVELKLGNLFTVLTCSVSLQTTGTM